MSEAYRVFANVAEKELASITGESPAHVGKRASPLSWCEGRSSQTGRQPSSLGPRRPSLTSGCFSGPRCATPLGF